LLRSLTRRWRASPATTGCEHPLRFRRPGAFLAKAFVERMPLHIHTAILDVVVIAGGVMMIGAALR
jgi:hypothetical protein